MVEPQEKAFCIAAVLPMPSYGSLLSSDPSSGFPRSQELPFSLSPCSAQSTAQQLTLLQQVQSRAVWAETPGQS